MNTNQLQIRPMRDDEIPAWGRLRSALWPDCTAEENAVEAANYRAGGDIKLVLLAWVDCTAIGFAELTERNIVDGCDGGPAAYLEGWYVDQNRRGTGIGKALVDAAVTWARSKGYSFLGSDTEIQNTASQKAHIALGFEQTGRIVTFRRSLRS